MQDIRKYEEYTSSMDDTVSEVLSDWKNLSKEQKKKLATKQSMYKIILKHDAGFFGNNLFLALTCIVIAFGVFCAVALPLYLNDNAKAGKIILIAGACVLAVLLIITAVIYFIKQKSLIEIYKGLKHLKKEISKNAKALQVYKKAQSKMVSLQNKLTANSDISEDKATELYEKFLKEYENLKTNKFVKAVCKTEQAKQ